MIQIFCFVLQRTARKITVGHGIAPFLLAPVGFHFSCGIFCPAPEKFPVLFLCTPGGKFLQAHVKAVGDTALSHFLPLP
jgi:hypothetical protein